MSTEAIAPGRRWRGALSVDATGALPQGLFRYVLATDWVHQLALLALTVGGFLLKVVPLELQRRVVNDAVKHRQFGLIVALCAAYVGAVLLQGATKLALNVYRAWVGERAKRDCAGESPGERRSRLRGPCRPRRGGRQACSPR